MKQPHKDKPCYSRWRGMIDRCDRPKCKNYKHYGGRGIRVHPRWRLYKNWWKDMGAPPTSEHTLERIDNNGNYEPGNVRWATKAEQRENMRRKGRSYGSKNTVPNHNQKYHIFWNEKEITQREAAEMLNSHSSSLWHRMNRRHKRTGRTIFDLNEFLWE